MSLENSFAVSSVAAEPLIQIKENGLMEASFQQPSSIICALTTDCAYI